MPNSLFLSEKLKETLARYFSFTLHSLNQEVNNTLKKMKLTLSTCYLENINSRYVKKSNLQILLIRYAFLSL